MKRRDFIINSAIAIGGATLLSGCGKKKFKSEKSSCKKKIHEY